MKHSNSISILILFSLLAVTANAQPPDTLWTRAYGERKYETAQCVQQTSDGGFITTGVYTSYIDDRWNYDVGLVKTGADGNREWYRFHGGEGQQYGCSVQQTTDGGYIITGFTNFNTTGQDVLLLKTDSAGNEEWLRYYRGSRNDVGYSVRQTPDGGYVIAGYTWTEYPLQSDILLMKVDGNGDPVWARRIGSDYNDLGNCVDLTAEGGFIVTGRIAYNMFGWYDLLLVKTDSDGNEIWRQTLGGDGDEEGQFVRQATDGGYIVIGESTSFGAGDKDIYLVKTDADGIETWSRTFGNTGYEHGKCVQPTADGGFVMTGSMTPQGSGIPDVWLAKVDADGNDAWSTLIGGTNTEYGEYVAVTTDGGYVVAGRTESYGHGNSDGWLIRLAPETLAGLSAQASAPTEMIFVNTYPNPFNLATTVSIDMPVASELKVQAFNLSGQKVATVSDGFHQRGLHRFTFDAADLPSGTYFLRAVVPGQVEQVQRVVLVK